MSNNLTQTLPLVETVLTVAADQQVERIMDAAGMFFEELLVDRLGYSEDGLEALLEGPSWDAIREDLVDIIRQAWTRRAAAAEKQMRDAGQDPAMIAGLKPPRGVLPS